MSRRQFPALGGAGAAALRAFVDRATVVAFDLDGTLAPIVAEPSQAFVPDEIGAALRRLARAAPLVVVTGRGRADARERLRFRPRLLVGNHGAEGLPGREIPERAYTRLGRGWETQLRSLRPAAKAAGVLVEDKGASLSLHYRNAPDRARARRWILRAVPHLTPPPRVVHGKYVENLLPRGAPDKGEALALVMQRLGCRRAVFVGDDVTDEAVFRLGLPAVFGIRVGRSPASAAPAYLRNQGEIARLIEELLALLQSLAAPLRSRRCTPPGPAASRAGRRARPSRGRSSAAPGGCRRPSRGSRPPSRCSSPPRSARC
jgi:trehalose 6-phosphate phosphatase